MSAVSPIIVCRSCHTSPWRGCIGSSHFGALCWGVWGFYTLFCWFYTRIRKNIHQSIKVSVWLVCGWYTRQRLYGSDTLGLRVSALANIHHFLSGSTYTHMFHGAGIFTYICPNIITQFCRQIYQHHGSHMGIVSPSYSISITIVYYSYIMLYNWDILYMYSYIWYQHYFLSRSTYIKRTSLTNGPLLVMTLMRLIKAWLWWDCWTKADFVKNPSTY